MRPVTGLDWRTTKETGHVPSEPDAPPDGYTLSQLNIGVACLPHRQKVGDLHEHRGVRQVHREQSVKEKAMIERLGLAMRSEGRAAR